MDMNRNLLLLLTGLFCVNSFFAFKKETLKSEEEVALMGNCNFDDEWYVQDILTSEVAEVGIFVTERQDSLYRLKTPKIIIFGEADPCHLPEKFRIEALKGIVSGKVFNHPRTDLIAPPIMLTKIEYGLLN
jgi:hypothetical protein